MRLGQIAGVDILLRSSWVLIAILIAVLIAPRVEQVAPGLAGPLAYVAGVVFAVLLYLSVLLHELSHALAARAFDIPVQHITLGFMGGGTHMDSDTNSPGREFVVSGVGPLTSLVVGFIALPIALVTPDGLITFLLEGLAFANIIVGVFNLVPGLPLDGGRMLQAVVWWMTKKPYVGSVVAGWTGRVLAVLVVAGPLVAQNLTSFEPNLFDVVLAAVIGLFLWQGASQSLVMANVRRKLPAIKARTLARRAIGVPPDLPLAEGLRRARAEQAGAMVVVAGDGRPLAVVNEAAVTATPVERRPWVSCSAVARELDTGLLLEATLEGEALMRAMQRTPATEYVLVEPTGGLFGVLSAADVDQAFAAS